MTVALAQTAGATGSHPRAPATFSDDILMSWIAAGDRLAMQTLFARHRVPVYRWLARIVRDEALAEDS